MNYWNFLGLILLNDMGHSVDAMSLFIEDIEGIHLKTMKEFIEDIEGIHRRY